MLPYTYPHRIVRNLINTYEFYLYNSNGSEKKARVGERVDILLKRQKARLTGSTNDNRRLLFEDSVSARSRKSVGDLLFICYFKFSIHLHITKQNGKKSKRK